MAEAPHTAPGETATGVEQEAGGGLPQFNTDYWPGQVLWFLIIFGVLLFLMRTVFVPKIGGAIEGREDKIGGDIAEARRLKSEAEAQAEDAAANTAQARSAAQRVALDARAKAQAEAAARMAQEEAKLAETTAAAEARIYAARDAAMGHVRKIADDTAQAMVEKLTGKAASAAELNAVARA